MHVICSKNMSICQYSIFSKLTFSFLIFAMKNLSHFFKAENSSLYI
jgi:hypothetical protein